MKITSNNEFIKKIVIFFYKILGYIATQLWKVCNLKRKNKYYFLPYGIGDLLFIMCYKNYFYDDNTYFIVNSNQKGLMKMYGIPDEKIKVVSEFWKLMLIGRCMASNYQNKDIIYAHQNRRIIPYKYENENLLGVKGLSLLDLNKVVLNIPQDSKVQSPKSILTKQKKKEIIIQNSFNMDKKNILLCPYATSSKMVSMDIWNSIIKKYLKQGYNIYTNVRNDTEKALENTIPLSLRLEELYGVVDQFEHVYSLRSGLCDLLAFSDVNLTVYYPPLECDNIYTSYNFKNLGIRDDIEEIITKK